MAVLYVSALLVRALVTELARRDLDVDAILGAAGFDRESLRGSGETVAAPRWFALLEHAASVCEDDGLGIAMGAHLPHNSFQLLTQLALASGTLREAIQLLQRYGPLLGNMADVELVEVGDLAYFVYVPHVEAPKQPRFSTELTLSLVYRVGTQFAQAPDEQLSAEACFTFDEPSYAARYAEVFDCPVRFGRPRNTLQFSRALLDKPQFFADTAVLTMLTAGAERLLSAVQQPPLADRVRALLHYEPDLCHVDTRRIARALKLHPRTLRRQLAAAQAPLSNLVDEVRREIACDALLQSEVSIKELSARLGFSEPSAFHRAFKRWTGSTPIAYGRK